MQGKLKIRLALGWLSIIIVGLITFNNSFFIHVHTLENGTVVSHAHPFNKFSDSNNESSQHRHSRNEIEIYQILNSATFFAFALLFELILVLWIWLKRELFLIEIFFLRFLSNQKIRPPPPAIL